MYKSSTTVEDQPEEYVENSSEDEDMCCEIQEIPVPRAVPLSPQDISTQQGFAEVTHVFEESPNDDELLEERVPLVHASLPSNEERGGQANTSSAES